MSFRSLLVNRCTIQRGTLSNTHGVQKATYAEQATEVPCLIQEGAGRIVSTRGGEGLEFDAVGFFLPSQDIQPRGSDDLSDRVIVTKPTTPGTTYLVLKVGDEAGTGHHLEAYLKRVPSAS